MEQILIYLMLAFVGVFGGIMVGSMPGFTPTMGVALLVPFTFHLPAIEGLILLGSVYVGSVYGGSITAILINIPGAPASIATLLDGYPMAKKGEGEKAIYLATLSSFVGGVVGVIILLLFSPILSQVSLSFGPAENFWVAVFGITIIASLSVGSLWKGLLGGTIGLLLSTVGMSTISGSSRFVFGISHLTGGVGLVAALIGLFAFPQALVLLEKILTNSEANQRFTYKQRKVTLTEACQYFMIHKKIAGLGTLIGAFIGLIPGAGGQVASLVAYNEIKKNSKEREKYGTGYEGGIVATETANNAMVGGSLVPLLTLGIPGSPTAAVLLGGLLMNGLWPGPGLFDQNAHITYTFIYGLLFAQFFLLAIGLLGGRFLKKVTEIPSYIMTTAIFVLCVLGSFATRNSLGDVIVMLILGVCMYIGLKLGFSPAPVALGLILGEYAERGFLLARRAAQGEGLLIHFVSSPIVLFFMGLTVLSLVTTAVFEYQKYRGVTKL